MTAAWKWAIAALVAAVLLVGGGVLAGYLIRTSSAEAYAVWQRGGDALAKAVRDQQRQHDDSITAVAVQLVATSHAIAHAAAAADTSALAVSHAVAAIKDSLAHATTPAAQLQFYPIVVARQDTEIVQLETSSAAWRTAYGTSDAANVLLSRRIASDTVLLARVLAHLDSAPKPPRHGIAFAFLHPCPYGRGEYVQRFGSGQRSGFEARAGLQVGGC